MIAFFRQLASGFWRFVFATNDANSVAARIAILSRVGALAFCVGTAVMVGSALGQEREQPAGPSAEPMPTLDMSEGTSAPAEKAAPVKEEINLFSLLIAGGTFMLPIAALSMLVATFGVERAISLRRGRILPKGLVDEITELGSRGGFDPRQAYQLCQKYPSAASTIIRAMLLKIGRPHSEVEQAVKDASNREANRVYANVRWLTFAASCGPLLGLLGTIYGIIIAFHDMTQLEAGVDKGEFLAGGIYVALVTTMSGLAVAIVAATLAHYFEARVQALFLEVEELLFHLLPQVERYEGRVRFTRGEGAGVSMRSDYANVQAPPAVESPV